MSILYSSSVTDAVSLETRIICLPHLGGPNVGMIFAIGKAIIRLNIGCLGLSCPYGPLFGPGVTTTEILLAPASLQHTPLFAAKASRNKIITFTGAHSSYPVSTCFQPLQNRGTRWHARALDISAKHSRHLLKFWTMHYPRLPGITSSQYVPCYISCYFRSVIVCKICLCNF
jgi:hypothetical protein